MDIILIYQILLIFISIILSAYFSATEAALTSLGELGSRLVIKDKGDKAKSLELWIKRPNRVINTILVGTNLFNIFATILAIEVVEKILGYESIAIATGIMTFLILFFGDITPKAFAKNNATNFSIFSMKILKFFYIIFYPITYTMHIVVDKLLKKTGVVNKKPKITEDQLEFLINVGEKEGILEKDKGEMLTNIFDISDIQVKEIMVPRIDIVAVSINITKEELLNIVKETEFSRILVYNESLDDIEGVLYVKDILKMDCSDYLVSDLMSRLRKPLFVPETKKIDAMLKEFQKHRLHLAVVIDEYGGTSGIVTMEDILEEIVGDILDEYDDDDAEITKISDNHYVINAGMDIYDFCEEFNFEKTEDMTEYDTLGGFVLDRAGEVPKVGYSFSWNNHIFTVKKMRDKRLERIELKKISDNVDREVCNG